MPYKLKFDTPQAIRRSLATLSNRLQNGSITAPEMNALVQAGRLALDCIRYEDQKSNTFSLSDIAASIATAIVRQDPEEVMQAEEPETETDALYSIIDRYESAGIETSENISRRILKIEDENIRRAAWAVITQGADIEETAAKESKDVGIFARDIIEAYSAADA